jgi:NAD-dependent dihydropyrimidine dehydrogenase PreA subunit
MVSIKVDVEKCTGCGTCVSTCPVAVYELREVKGKTVTVVVAEDQCIICRACEAQCPEKAIEVIE